MATSSSVDTLAASVTAPGTPSGAPTAPANVRSRLLVCLPSLPVEDRQAAIDAVAAAFPDEPVQVAGPSPADFSRLPANLRLVAYAKDRLDSGWVLDASDFAVAAGVTAESQVESIVLLGGGAVDGAALREMVACARSKNIDLVLPRFTPGPSGGQVITDLLYPLTRALFGTDIHFPLPVDAVLSSRMAGRLASVALRQTAASGGAALVWPVAEAAIAGFSVREVSLPAEPPRGAPQDDFNDLFNSVAGSLFTDVEAKASFWQRARSPGARPAPQLALPPAPAADTPDIEPMIESFRLAQANLQEIWSLVLPPQSRLALKKLATTPSAEFALEPALWARVVYDFTLTFHLRSLNRSHLLGAMMPLYLAWVASHLLAVGDDPDRAARRIEDTAAAFETEKPYLVSRWRWPDRFNP